MNGVDRIVFGVAFLLLMAFAVWLVLTPDGGGENGAPPDTVWVEAESVPPDTIIVPPDTVFAGPDTVFTFLEVEPPNPFRWANLYARR